MTDNATDVIFSDGFKTRVRKMGLYELLDTIPKPVITPYQYTVELVGGGTSELTLEPHNFPKSPEKPETLEHLIEHHSNDWYELRTYQRYHMMMEHERKNAQLINAHMKDRALYIMKSCLVEEAIKHIFTDDDWDIVHSAALVEEVTMELLAKTLHATFEATWNERQIFDALKDATGGNASYNSIRMWEIEVMIKMSMNEIEYAQLDTRERARKICANKLNGWIEALDADHHEKVRELTGGRSG